MKIFIVFCVLLLRVSSFACDADTVDKVAIEEVKKMAKEMQAEKFGLGTAFIEPDRILMNFIIYDVKTYGAPTDVIGTLNLSKKCVLRDGALGPIRNIE